MAASPPRMPGSSRWAWTATPPPAGAQAQVSGGLAITNDYRVRGISYSNQRPAVSVSLAGDFAGGAYAGATAVVQDVTDDVRMLGDVEYLGYAHRLSSGVTWEAG